MVPGAGFTITSTVYTCKVGSYVIVVSGCPETCKVSTGVPFATEDATVTCKRDFEFVYVALVILSESVIGCTVTFVVADPLSPRASVAVSWKLNTCAGWPDCILGAMKLGVTEFLLSNVTVGPDF